jgi:hypothetical protein
MKNECIARSKNQVPIRLTEERWLHIITSHTEMNGNILELIRTIEDPETITKGVRDELRCIRFFPHTHLGPKYLMVAYKELSPNDGFIITAYKTSRIRKLTSREIVWTRQN